MATKNPDLGKFHIIDCNNDKKRKTNLVKNLRNFSNERIKQQFTSRKNDHTSCFVPYFRYTDAQQIELLFPQHEEKRPINDSYGDLSE